ncbi:MAG: hypothetical protein CO020_00755 [Candidatus Colwellbacteria bacterium CG_4_9_14_0_2_um_filter_50_12]|uniref:Alpha-D-phosphohexomutase alpha/beta/alpha domain-containing protein n=1 Tax=Candidatus Colwellbacteria bacterium CG_4_9_14_0_2_um_filter_50_12 TaxID=1974538 RepID=A0A2M8G199_9BACT|nr:MAG: hypothetical protein CO020_00755 [Candidatus Colwellbacteria bacterium CG_4_9_14_0_2_um_filter_50_12]
MDKGIFRAYDIRGIYPEELDERSTYVLGRVLASRIFKRGKIIVGHDVRLSSPALYRAILRGLRSESSGSRIVTAGLVTTPMLWFLVHRLKAAGGAMVTASHNPKEYNGLKVVRGDETLVSGREILKELVAGGILK